MATSTATTRATVRLPPAARETLRVIAKAERSSMQSVLEKAIEEYRRRHFLHLVNAAYELERRNERGWAKLQEEHAAWDHTLADGLPPDEPPAKRQPAARRRAKTKRR